MIPRGRKTGRRPLIFCPKIHPKVSTGCPKTSREGSAYPKLDFYQVAKQPANPEAGTEARTRSCVVAFERFKLQNGEGEIARVPSRKADSGFRPQGAHNHHWRVGRSCPDLRAIDLTFLPIDALCQFDVAPI